MIARDNLPVRGHVCKQSHVEVDRLDTLRTEDHYPVASTLEGDRENCPIEACEYRNNVIRVVVERTKDFVIMFHATLWFESFPATVLVALTRTELRYFFYHADIREIVSCNTRWPEQEFPENGCGY